MNLKKNNSDSHTLTNKINNFNRFSLARNEIYKQIHNEIFIKQIYENFFEKIGKYFYLDSHLIDIQIEEDVSK